MQHSICQARMTKRGVAFAVSSGTKQRECLISTAALERIAALKNVDATDADPMEIFRAFEATINGVAERLVAGGDASHLIRLQPESFDDMRAAPAASLFAAGGKSGGRPPLSGGG